MAKISFSQKGDFKKLSTFLQKAKQGIKQSILDKYGREGVKALTAATPVNTGLTASSWYYEIERNKDSVSLVFKNSNVNNGVQIAIILQYGHATGTGGWVEGIDYINPAVQPIFEKLANDAWKEVSGK